MWRWLTVMFSPYGRVSRRQMWMLYLTSAVIGVMLLVVGAMLLADVGPGVFSRPGYLNGLILAYTIIPGLAAPIKRYHDRGKSGWVAVGNLIIISLFLTLALLAYGAGTADTTREAWRIFAPIFLASCAVIIAAVSAGELFFLPGEPGDNRYGSDPRTPQIRALEPGAANAVRERT